MPDLLTDLACAHCLAPARGWLTSTDEDGNVMGSWPYCGECLRVETAHEEPTKAREA